ncbi:MAG: C-GCAxxG-C-C family protein [Actinomycetia bacterium]|nr:C-GCAxxG-C-C family protein [Actinomycetes bacterium]
MPPEAIKLASGFPVGIGTGGCTCGALSGGVMVLGLVGSPAHVDQCVAFTGDVAEHLAGMLND